MPKTITEHDENKCLCQEAMALIHWLLVKHCNVWFWQLLTERCHFYRFRRDVLEGTLDELEVEEMDLSLIHI